MYTIFEGNEFSPQGSIGVKIANNEAFDANGDFNADDKEDIWRYASCSVRFTQRQRQIQMWGQMKERHDFY